MRIAGESESITEGGLPSQKARLAAENVNDISGRVNLNTAKNMSRKRGDRSDRKSNSPKRSFGAIHNKGMRTANNLFNESSGMVASDTQSFGGQGAIGFTGANNTMNTFQRQTLPASH